MKEVGLGGPEWLVFEEEDESIRRMKGNFRDGCMMGWMEVKANRCEP